MGRRSAYKVNSPRDYWPTVDSDAVKPLLQHLKGTTYAEPCAGNGSLTDLIDWGNSIRCEWESDLEPQAKGIRRRDALALTKDDLAFCDMIITNPPFTWEMLHPLIDHFISLKPTWLLLPSAFMHNKRTAPYMKKCSKVVSVGRLYWVVEKDLKPTKGKEDYCWYFWPKSANESVDTVFYNKWEGT